jgi:hypothetical protein
VDSRVSGDDIEQQLRESGAEFVKSHDRTEAAIRIAAESGMSDEAIVRVSGLSPETIAAFLRRPQQ